MNSVNANHNRNRFTVTEIFSADDIFGFQTILLEPDYAAGGSRVGENIQGETTLPNVTWSQHQANQRNIEERRQPQPDWPLAPRSGRYQFNTPNYNRLQVAYATQRMMMEWGLDESYAEAIQRRFLEEPPLDDYVGSDEDQPMNPYAELPFGGAHPDSPDWSNIEVEVEVEIEPSWMSPPRMDTGRMIMASNRNAPRAPNRRRRRQTTNEDEENENNRRRLF